MRRIETDRDDTDPLPSAAAVDSPPPSPPDIRVGREEEEDQRVAAFLWHAWPTARPEFGTELTTAMTLDYDTAGRAAELVHRLTSSGENDADHTAVELVAEVERICK